MGKISRIIRSFRRKDFLVSFWATFLTVLAFPSAALTILGAHWSALSTAGLIAFALAFSAVIHRQRLAKTPLPAQPEILWGGKTLLRCPGDSRLADEAKLLAQESYPSDRSITPERFEQLRVKNPEILACLTTVQGELLGYFDAIPLREQFAHLFLRGLVTEMQITHEDILTKQETDLCKYLFISGLAVQNPESQVGRQSASILVWGIMKYVQHFYGSAKPLIFALASSRPGHDLLRKFRFDVGREAATRIDQYTLYQLPLSREAINMRLACIPDWSPLCSLDWSPQFPERPLGRRHRVSLPRHRTYDLPSHLSPRSI
jgi:hypothetical protein